MILLLIWLIGGILYTIPVAYLIKQKALSDEWLASCPVWFLVIGFGIFIMVISTMVLVITAPFVFVASLILKKPFWAVMG